MTGEQDWNLDWNKTKTGIWTGSEEVKRADIISDTGTPGVSSQRMQLISISLKALNKG